MALFEGSAPLAEAPATVQFQLPMVVNTSNPSEYVPYSPEKPYIMYKPEHPQPLAVPLWGRVIRAGKAKLPKKNADGIVARDEQGQVVEVESPDVSIVIVEHAPDSSGRVYQTKLVGKFVVSSTITVGTSVATGQSVTNGARAVRFDMSLKDLDNNTFIPVHPEEEGKRLASDLTKQAQAKRQAELDAAQLAQRSAPKPLQAPPEWQVYHAFGSANESGEPRPLTTIHLTTKNPVVRAFLPGTVTNVTPSLPPARGSVVIIAHANGMHSTFRGLAQIDVKMGDTVFAGQTTIGLASLTDRRFEYGISRGASNGRPNWVDPFAIDAKEFVRLDMFPPILNDDQAIIQARIATHPNTWPVSMPDPEHEPQQNLFFAHLKDPAINILFEQAWRLEQRREVYSDSPIGLLKSIYEIWLEAADRQRQGLLADWHFKYGDVLDAARNAVSAQWIAIQKAYDTGATISWQQVERLKAAMEHGADGKQVVSDFIWSAPIGDLPTVFGAVQSIWNDGSHPERIPDGQDMATFREVRASIYDHCRHHFWDLHVGNSAAVSQRLESHILSAPTDVAPIKEAQKGIAIFEGELLSLLEPKTQYKSTITRTQNQFTREFCTARAMDCIKNLYQSSIIAVSEQLETLYNSTPNSPQFDAAIEQIIIQIAPDVPEVMRRHQVKAIVDVVRSKTAQATTSDQKKAGITTARKYLVTEDKNGRKSVGEMFLINSHRDFATQHSLYVKTYQNTLHNVAQKLPKLLEGMPQGKDQEEVINQAIDTENAKAPNGVFPALVANQKLQIRVSLQNDVMTYVNLTQIPTLLKNTDFTQKVWLPDKAVNKLQQIWSQISVSLDGNAEFIAMVTAEVKRVKPTATQAEIVRACSEAKTRLYMAGLFQAVEKIRLREALRNKEHASDIDAEMEKNPELRVYVEATWVRGMLEVSDDDAMKVGEFVVQNILITAATMGAGLLIRGAVAATFEATATGAANLASRMAPSLSSGLGKVVNWNMPYASEALATTDALASTAGTSLSARALALSGRGLHWVVGHTLVAPVRNIGSLIGLTAKWVGGTVAMVTEYGLGWEAMNFANNLFTAGSNDSLLRGSAFGANDLLPWAAQAFQHTSILFVANMAGTVGTAWITSLADKVPSAWAKLGVRMFGAALQSIITTPAVRFAGDFAGSYNRLPAWEETNPMNLLESFFQDLTIEQFAQLATFCFLAGRITPATVKKYPAEVQKSWADLQDSFRGLMVKRTMTSAPAPASRTEPHFATPVVLKPIDKVNAQLTQTEAQLASPKLDAHQRLRLEGDRRDLLAERARLMTGRKSWDPITPAPPHP